MPLAKKKHIMLMQDNAPGTIVKVEIAKNFAEYQFYL